MGTGGFDQGTGCGRDLGKGETGGISQHRGEEAVFGVHGDGDMDFIGDKDASFVPLSIE